MRLVLVTNVFGAPAAEQQPEWAPVITDPARGFDDVRRKHATSKTRPDAIETAECPERLAVAVPFKIILFVIAPKKALQSGRPHHSRALVEHGRVIGAEL